MLSGSTENTVRRYARNVRTKRTMDGMHGGFIGLCMHGGMHGTSSDVLGRVYYVPMKVVRINVHCIITHIEGF